jgi:hypothetical protein
MSRPAFAWFLVAIAVVLLAGAASQVITAIRANAADRQHAVACRAQGLDESACCRHPGTDRHTCPLTRTAP